MSAPASLRVVFLGSGSSGNATAVTDGATTLLVDCGFSAREVARRMAIVGLSADSVSAVLVTHEHSDHIRGVDVFSRRHACAVLATDGTCRAAGFSALGGDAGTLEPGSPVRIGTLSVLPFRTSHDATEPVGFTIETEGGERFGLATDTGVLTPEAAEALTEVDVLGIESNHDLQMLANGPYPAYLKRRIRSESGHLSNADAADAIELLATERLRRVFALHRSRQNNTSQLAARQLRRRVRDLGLSVRVHVAEQDGVLDSAPPQGTLFGAEGLA